MSMSAEIRQSANGDDADCPVPAAVSPDKARRRFFGKSTNDKGVGMAEIAKAPAVGRSVALLHVLWLCSGCRRRVCLHFRSETLPTVRR